MVKRNAVERFWARVVKGGPEECWTWTGKRHDPEKGYGRIKADSGRREFAHRFSWTLAHGDPGELCVLHKCDNTMCVNPKHLFLGTLLDNNEDKVRKGRQAKGDRAAVRLHPEIVQHGEDNHRAKLTNEDALAARKAAASGERVGALAKRYGVNNSTMSVLLAGQTFRNVPMVPGIPRRKSPTRARTFAAMLDEVRA